MDNMERELFIRDADPEDAKNWWRYIHIMF